MGTRFRADGVIGRVAMYENTDDAPWSAPTSYPTRTIFHSGLGYPARIATLSQGITLPQRNAPAAAPFVRTALVTHQLVAHGRPGIPMIEGRVSGVSASYTTSPNPNIENISIADTIPLVGTVPIQISQLVNSGTGAVYGTTSESSRWITLGADATWILLHELYTTRFESRLIAKTITVEVHVLDIILV